MVWECDGGGWERQRRCGDGGEGVGMGFGVVTEDRWGGMGDTGCLFFITNLNGLFSTEFDNGGVC